MANRTVANYRLPDISFAVRLLRQARNLSQRQLALRVGTSRQYISKLELRCIVPNVSTLLRLAAGLRVSPYVLIKFAEFGKRPLRNSRPEALPRTRRARESARLGYASDSIMCSLDSNSSRRELPA